MSAALSQVGGSAQKRSREDASRAILIAQAGMRAADVDYISAHATSTPIGDRLEARELNVRRDVQVERARIFALSRVQGRGDSPTIRRGARTTRGRAACELDKGSDRAFAGRGRGSRGSSEDDGSIPKILG